MAEPHIVDALPVYHQEMGDTWIYGVPSDPLKLSKFRAAQRLRGRCLMEKKCSLESDTFFNFSRFLLKNGEHTFGGTVKFIGKNLSTTVWSNEQLEVALHTDPEMTHFSRFRDTWYEQRRIGIDYAMEALSETKDENERDLYQSIVEEFEYLDNVEIPDITDSTEWIKMDIDGDRTFEVSMNGNSKYNVIFDSVHGAIKSLYNAKGNHFVNTTDLPADSGIGLFLYQTYTADNFSTFWNEYVANPAPCNLEFCKNGLSEHANFTDIQYNAYQRIIQFYRNKNDENVFLGHYDLGEDSEFLHKEFGAPEQMMVKFNFSSPFETGNGETADGFGIELKVISKQYTRLPETLWMTFTPNIQFDDVFVNKSGEYVDINNVMTNGTYHLHSVDPNGCVRSVFGKNEIRIYPLDVSVASFMPLGFSTFTDIVTPFVESVESHGCALSLFNNFWGTNYPQWYPFDPNDANQAYRFNVYVS